MTTSKEHLIIFDTTLRDGEQSPGASMTRDEKLRIAQALERLQVDVIEAGFPVASPGDFAAVQAIARTVRESRVCGLSRARDEDIRRAGEALKEANAARIHTFIATSPIHMQAKLRMSPEQVLERAVAAVKLARQYCDDVEFSPEDAGRSEEDFLCRVIEAVIQAGARTINIPDTVGYNLPDRFGQLIANLRNRIPNADQAIFSVHCHNDLGLAVANSLSAVQHGARQVECTINGLGERAGNAALEEIVMAVRTRQDAFACDTRIDTSQIVATSKLVSTITGFPVQPNKAIVGANAFAHESGIHQDGVLKHRETYEIMRAEDVGWSANRMTLGKLSGRAAVRARLEALGIHLEKDTLDQVFARFKDLADRKAEIFDEDLQALVNEDLQEEQAEHYRLGYLRVCSEMGTHPEATVEVWVDGVAKTAKAVGGGPVDAAFQAMESILNSETRLLLYSVNAITTGTDAQGDVTVRLQDASGRAVNGQGADTDIVVASAKAYLSAMNRLQGPAQRQHPQL
ncbi:2-isopropylmalate synthase [Acidithiobacillus sulfurivorans]|uniref:2-isopropylmalate synthase n=1 Tax=Acidithiobacillus sulfurivorans TaxID=1958756 RepID=A0ABS6A2W3_9PROT|nr:2-isopropylmalate synthase [Acidithiobacillus sulfurivorans]MBU2761600.1 2-isopropylmalate synthase [Acidithiobacillus sulfurivorans]